MLCGLEGLQTPLHVLPEDFFILALLFIWRDEVTAVAGLVLAEGEAKRHRVSSWPHGARSIPAPVAGSPRGQPRRARECSPAAGACRGSLAARGAWQRPPCPGGSAPCRSPAGPGTPRSRSPSCGDMEMGGWRRTGWAPCQPPASPGATRPQGTGQLGGHTRSVQELRGMAVLTGGL